MDFFDIELLRNSPENTSFYTVFVAAMLAFFLSSLIAITYELTTRSIYKKANFLQSIALIGIVAAVIMQAIGDSVAIGLGMLGALSIIRFRNAMSDPRNITFIFASLGSGIAVGVFGFTIALVGVLVFCAAAFILSFSPLGNAEELIGELRLRVPKNDEAQAQIEKALAVSCRNFELDQVRFLNTQKKTAPDETAPAASPETPRENLQEFTYLIRLKASATATTLSSQLNDVEGLEELRLSFRKQATRL